MSTPMALEDREAWTADALGRIEAFARSGLRFTVNDLRKSLRPAPHPNLYGSVFRTAKSRGIIAEVGTGRAAGKASHGRRVVAWAGMPDRHLRAVA